MMSSSPKKRARRQAALELGVDATADVAPSRAPRGGGGGGGGGGGTRARRRGGARSKTYGHFTVALVGRPNVGKSTLFNRLVGRRAAIVNAAPGTTRDWKEGAATLAGMDFTVVDTGGLDDRAGDGQMLEYTSHVLATADVAVFLVDARDGIGPDDRHFARWVARHRGGAPTVLVANKTEGMFDGVDGQEAWDLLAADAATLGLGTPAAVAAEHGEGMGDLFEVLEPFAEAAAAGVQPPAPDQLDPLRDVCLAIVGRPNVGKSTLLNRLLGADRVMTGPQPGVTRDSTRVAWEYNNRTVHLVDTAGIRRLGMWDPTNALESLAVANATKALGAAHVVALVLDANEPLTRQDMSIAQAVLDEGRALVIVLNKSDVLPQPGPAVAALQRRLQDAVADAHDVPCLPMSALEGTGVTALMPRVLQSFEAWNFRTTTGRLNKWLELLCRHHPPPAAFRTMRRWLPGRSAPVPVSIPLKLKYITQVKARPPTFTLYANRQELPEAYHRFLVNALREEFDFHGVPVRLLIRAATNPFKGTKGNAPRTGGSKRKGKGSKKK